MQRNRVDLPEPLGPMIATTEPRSTFSDALQYRERAEGLP
jgi:hypothetical protein